MIHLYTFVIIVNDFQKVLHCACAIKTPVISQFPTPTGLTRRKPYFHQISLNCLEKLVDCIGRFNKGEIGADTSCQREKQILTDEIQDTEFLEFAIENYSEVIQF